MNSNEQLESYEEAVVAHSLCGFGQVSGRVGFKEFVAHCVPL
jgi:hypothetical protein